MQIDNPWIAGQCQLAGVEPNRLRTYLQEQYGQLGEDLLVEGLLKAQFAANGLRPDEVRYLEVGANHPIQTSNSFLFARKWGGRGVLVEANPALIDTLRRVRPNDRVLNVAIVPTPGIASVRLNVSTNTELSSVDPGHIGSFGSIGQIAGVVEVPAMTLDQVLAEAFDGDVHLMSIDIEGLDLDVLAASRFARRPWLVVTEPSRHYHANAEANFQRVMQGQGYVEVSRTDYNLIYADAARLAAHLARAGAAQPISAGPRSFDIFDTLIARRCIWPAVVFEEVEHRSGRAGFAQARRAAEAAFGDREYTLADIHGLLAHQLGLAPEEAQALMALEVEAELENVMPVADALAQVQADSLLITDMYLPEAVIRRLLQRAGLPGHFTLLRSAHGKRSGRVWAALVEAGTTVHHLGDNPRADIEQPRAAGLQATLATQVLPTPTEAALVAAGLTLLARALREARLTTPRGALDDDLLRLQSELNLPVLAVSALHLLATAGELPQLRLLFSSRDARYLQNVYDALATGLPGAHPSSHYWYSSRLARTGGEPDYLAYCRELIGPAAWLVDLCGTGASVLALRERLGIPAQQAQLFVCEFIDSPQQTAELMSRYGLGQWQPPAALWTDKTLVPNEVLELLNYVPEGMVRGVRAVPGGFLPLREPMEFTPGVLAQVRTQEAYVHAFARQLAAAVAVPGDALLREFRERGPQACVALGTCVPALAPQMSRLLSAWLPGHRQAEAALRERLGARA